MLQALARLRASPKSVRDRYAFGVAASFTVVVALVWAIALPSRFADTPTDQVASKSALPFASLLKVARDQFAAVTKANQDTKPVVATEDPKAPTAPVATPPLNPNAITLTPEEISAAEGRAEGYVAPATTTPQAVQVVTTSSLRSSTTATTTTQP